MAANTPVYKKWWFWTIVAVFVVPLYLLILRGIGFATADIATRQDSMVYDESAAFTAMSPSPSQEAALAATPVPSVEPTVSPTPVSPPYWTMISPSSAESKKAVAKTPAPTQAPKTNPAPTPAVSSEYAAFLTGIYQGIMSDMETFNQLDNQMKSNKALLRDDTWLDALFNNITSLETHCKKIIDYDAAKVPGHYTEIHTTCKTGCQLYMDAIDKYIYGVDLEEGSARVEGRSMMQEAAAILNNAVSSLQ